MLSDGFSRTRPSKTACSAAPSARLSGAFGRQTAELTQENPARQRA